MALERFGPIPPGKTDEEIREIGKEIEERAERELKTCRDKHAKTSVGKPALEIGISPLWVSEDGQTKNLEWSGLVAWSSFSVGFDDLLFTANVRYKSQDPQPDPLLGQLIEGYSLSAGGRIRYGGLSSGLLVQAVYTNFDSKNGRADGHFLYSVGGEIKLADNFWLEASVGGTSGKEGSDNGFVSGQFKWGISETSVLK